MWRRFNLKHRIYMILAGLVGITVCGGLVMVWYTYRVESVILHIIDKNVAALQIAESLETAIVNQKGFVSYYYLDGNADWLTRLDDYRRVFDARLGDARQSTQDRQQAEAIDQIKILYDQYIVLKDQVIAHYQAGDRNIGSELHRRVREQFFTILALCEKYKEMHIQSVRSAQQLSSARLDDDPDVVILDIKMPGIDGHEALQEIKKRKPDLPVIMLTGHGALPSAKEALGKGAFDYLSKPCDIELLAAKVKEACHQSQIPIEAQEKRVHDAMVPIEDYTTLSGDQSVATAIAELKASFACKISTSRIMETGHRSVLVMEAGGAVAGIVAITDLLKMIMPAYLSASKPSTADSIQYSPMFWNGMFTAETRRNSRLKVNAVMSPAPPVIDGAASLMEAAYRMHTENARRLVVVSSDKVVGVIREQDLFFEMERILSS